MAEATHDVEALHAELERTRAELERVRVRADAILEAAVDGIVTIDENGLVLSLNPSAEKIFGYSEDEVVGRNVSMLMPNPDSERHDQYLRNYLETGVAQIIGIGREVTGQRKDGSQFSLDLAVSEVHEGEGRWFMGTVRDITERKRVERELRHERDFAESLVETAQTIVLLLDQDGNIVRYNRYMEEISGIPLDLVRGKRWFDTFVPDSARAEVAELFEVALDGTPTRGIVSPIVTRDGSLRDIEWFDTTLTDAEGNVTGILAVGQDLTPRRRLEEQVRQSQKLEAIGRLAGGVAHDFNTLLGSITGYAEILLDAAADGWDEENLRAVRQIHRAAERGAALTSQLLAFSRRQVLQPRVLDLNVVVEEMDGLMKRLIGAHIELVQNLAPEPLPVKVDVSQMEQVIMNLVVNACDAMDGGGRLELETGLAGDEATSCPECDGSCCVQLRVRDSGVGMDEETKGRIFEPFFTTKEPGKGTGLGLSTVYGIVTQSQGNVRVESAEGKGTTFVICLPRASEDASVPALPLDREPSEGGSEVILLVEDDSMFRELLAEVLESKGYQVWTAGDPAEALGLCAGDARPDLLVSDMVMPGHQTGAELADELRARDPALRVLLMSGYTDDALGSRGGGPRPEVGPRSAFVHKPFSTKDFTAKVRELLDLD